VGYPVPTNEAMTIKVQWYNCFIRNGRNAIPKHACPQAIGSSPTAGLSLLWAYIPFRANFTYWQVSQEEARWIIPVRQLRNAKVIVI
jgi:hypothetical protein